MKAFEIGTRKTVIFYLHGLRGHGYAQKSVLRHMSKGLNAGLVALELPGHGKDSFTDHCMVPEYRQIVSAITDEIKRRAGDAEQIILMGYSFGGTLMVLAADALDRDPGFKPKVAGLVGISTAFDVAHNVPAWQLLLASAIAPMSRFLFRNIRQWSHYVTIGDMDVTLISREANVQVSILNDDLVYKGRIPLNTSAQVYRTSIAAKKVVNKVNFPVLLAHSRDDVIAKAPKPEKLAPHIKLNLFNTLRHNCIDGVSREAVKSRRAIIQFIVEKL